MTCPTQDKTTKRNKTVMFTAIYSNNQSLIMIYTVISCVKIVAYTIIMYILLRILPSEGSGSGGPLGRGEAKLV